MKHKLPQCPYCGNRLSFFGSFVKKTDDEFVCFSCGNVSKIKFKNKFSTVSLICELIAFFIVMGFLFVDSDFLLIGVFLVILPFLYIYSKVPSMMYFKPIKSNKEKSEAKDFDDEIDISDEEIDISKVYR